MKAENLAELYKKTGREMADNPFTDRNRPKPALGNAPPLSTLIGRSVFVVLTNLVSLNGVVRLGWKAVPLVLMFILEGVAVLFTDSIKRLFDRGIVAVSKLKMLFESSHLTVGGPAYSNRPIFLLDRVFCISYTISSRKHGLTNCKEKPR